MVNKKECPYCKRIIEFEHKNGFAGHCGGCKQRPGYWNGIEKAKRTRLINSKRKDYEFKCIKCEKLYIVNLTPHLYKIGKYRKHCSQLCANGHIQTEEQNKKRRKTILRKIKLGEIIPHHKEGLKGKLNPLYKETGCERVNREIRFKTFDKFKGVCQKCGKQLIKKETRTWIAHHNNKHINKEEYYDDEDRILYCIKCHVSNHNKNIPTKDKIKRFRLFDYIDVQ